MRGLLAVWMGGAASPPQATGGPRGLLAFWMGGAAIAASDAVEVSEEPFRSVPYERHRRPWHPHQETDEERAQRIRRERIRLGIIEEPKESVAQAPGSSASTGADGEGAVSRSNGEPLSPASPIASPASAVLSDAGALTAAQVDELRLLVQLEMKRRNNAALALILLSAAMH
jgi:hypothetical protein